MRSSRLGLTNSYSPIPTLYFPPFHVKPDWIRAAEYAGIRPGTTQIAQMERYVGWLIDEAVPAGGIGPGEIHRLDRRHLADSLLFASEIPQSSQPIWDLGTGVGLPGVPLAICLPGSEFVLIDRSRRRIELLRRAIRILGLDNCRVVRDEIARLDGQAAVIVSRASLSPDALLPIVRSHLEPGGTAIVAGSWQSRPQHRGWTTIEIPQHVLDHTVWLLMMRRE